MKKVQLLLVLVAAVLLVSCGKKKISNNEIEYLPFQETKGGNWGMISPEGEVLFSEEFNNEPTVAINGRFLVKNADNLWEIYTAEKKPKKIGSEYLYAGVFFEDVAPVVEKGQRIQFIDRDGNVKATLDKINGKAVTHCSNFINGQAKVKAGDLWGVVDTNGKVVIEPKYCQLLQQSEGYYIAIDKQYADEKDHDNIVYTILSDSGKELGSVKGSKFKKFGNVATSYRTFDCIADKSLIVEVEKNDKTVIGLMDFNGEWKVEPMSKVKELMQFNGKYYSYYTGDACGVMDMKGEEIIRAKYRVLFFVDDDILVVKKPNESSFSLYTLDDEKIGKDEYLDMYPFINGYAYVKVSKSEWTLINKKGEDQKLKTDVYQVRSEKFADKELESDYLDTDEVTSELRISKEGFLGLDTNMTGPEVIEVINGLQGLKKKLYKSDVNKYYAEFMVTKVQLNKAISELTVNTAELTKKQRTGSGWFSYMKTEWTDNKVQGYRLSFDVSDNNRLSGKMKELYDKIQEAIKNTGKVVKQGKNAIIVDAGNGNYYFACWAGNNIKVFYGKYNVDSIDLDPFDNAVEEESIAVYDPQLASDAATEVQGVEEEDYGELESPPADDL